MNLLLPTNNLDLLKHLIGKRIISVKRQIFKGDVDLVDFEQSADGPIELQFSEDEIIHFSANTESFSVGVAKGKMLPYGSSYFLKDVTENTFWKERINKKIIQIVILSIPDPSEGYEGEFGINIVFEDKKEVIIQYLDNENFPDMVNIGEKYSGPVCKKLYLP